ncbi:MAG: chemotaxis protein CheX [Acidimicrobiia bacterium]
MTLTVELDALHAVAPEIWEMMLGVSMTFVADGTHEWGEMARTITGLVTVVGDWTGAITVQSTTTAARKFAALMFGADDPDELPLEEVRDAHAELVNMVGGNMKNMVEGKCTLGIPTVTEGVGYEVRLPRTQPTQQFVYDCDGDAVMVVVYEPVSRS